VNPATPELFDRLASERLAHCCSNSVKIDTECLEKLRIGRWRPTQK
jgi:hypothetical protein